MKARPTCPRCVKPVEFKYAQPNVANVVEESGHHVVTVHEYKVRCLSCDRTLHIRQRTEAKIRILYLGS